jgi:hypothetical protein
MEGDSKALEELFKSSKPGQKHRVQHYLYLPRMSDANEAARLLEGLHFRIAESRMGADGQNWLLLAEHDVLPTLQLITETRVTLTKLASKFDGEYDGWEAEVVS